MNHPPSADVPPNLVTTTTTAPWQISHFVKRNEATVGALRLRLVSSAVHQQVEGFGGCFNETGWEVLSLIDPHARAAVLLALFDRMAGCGFNLGRMPIGANDYSLVWYSLDDVSDDLILEYFNIERDRAHLIPLHPRGTTTQPGPEHLGIAVVPARVDEDKWPLRVHAGPSQRPQARAGRGGDGPVVSGWSRLYSARMLDTSPGLSTPTTRRASRSSPGTCRTSQTRARTFQAAYGDPKTWRLSLADTLVPVSGTWAGRPRSDSGRSNDRKSNGFPPYSTVRLASLSAESDCSGLKGGRSRKCTRVTQRSG